MARNKITDLRDHLFAQIERLNDEDIKPEKLSTEIERAKAIVEVARVVVDSAKVEVEYVKVTGMTKSDSPLLQPLNENKQLKVASV